MAKAEEDDGVDISSASLMPMRDMMVSIQTRGSACDESQESFTLLSWNCLAQSLTKGAFFPSCPSDCLTWESRAPKIVQEIVRYAPDVVCLQEVDRWDGQGGIACALNAAGYDGSWLKRTGLKQDGVALAWRRGTLRLDATREVQFGQKNGVALMAHLLFGGGKSVVVGTTHLFWDPSHEYVKLQQAEHFLSEASRFSAASGATALALAGDLNSLPRSAVMQLFTQGDAELASPSQHMRGFRSALGPVAPAYDPAPEFTTLTDSFRGALDHIFTSAPLVSTAVLGM
jgi:mRNA deadenylase 3'-5' endonuclease subunit Ccr4